MSYVFSAGSCVQSELQVRLVAQAVGAQLQDASVSAPSLPALAQGSALVFGCSAVCRLLMEAAGGDVALLDQLQDLAAQGPSSLALLEARAPLLLAHPAHRAWMVPAIAPWIAADGASYPQLAAIVSAVERSADYRKVAATLLPPLYPEDQWLRKGVVSYIL